MQLPLQDAKRCIDLFDELDSFVIRTGNIFKRGEKIVVEDVNEVRLKVRSYWQKDSSFIENFISSTKTLSQDDIDVLIKWKNRGRSDFLILRYCSEYAVFFSEEDKKMYGVLALTENFVDILPYEPPIMVRTSLFPYKENIIWDGLVQVFGVEFGKNFTQQFTVDFEKAKRNGELIFQL